MSVACTGDVRVIEQLGEKQDFEAELSRRGFRHEDFALQIARVAASGAGWDPRYDVAVIHVPTRSKRIYQAGPRRNWVSAFIKDLIGGLYGPPTLSRSAEVPPLVRRH